MMDTVLTCSTHVTKNVVLYRLLSTAVSLTASNLCPSSHPSFTLFFYISLFIILYQATFNTYIWYCEALIQYPIHVSQMDSGRVYFLK